jgi:putative glycosyltransferase
MSTPALSIVTSMYNSAPYLREFYDRCVAAASQLTASFELVLVNDGSPDASLQQALALREVDDRVRVIDLSRNFGHHKALMTGLERAHGDLVFLIDCDLEEDPAWLLRFAEVLRATAADVVYGVQAERRGTWFGRATGWFFYSIVNRLLEPPIPANVLTARLMTARYVRALVSHRDREVCLAGLWVLTGFDQQALAVQKQRRTTSAYTLRRRVSAAANAVTSFSNRPLLYIFQLGMAVTALAVVAGAVLLYQSLSGRIGVPGWASIMVSIWFLGGLTIFSIGILGIYLAKVFTETKRRPYTVVRREYGPGHEHAAD